MSEEKTPGMSGKLGGLVLEDGRIIGADREQMQWSFDGPPLPGAGLLLERDWQASPAGRMRLRIDQEWVQRCVWEAPLQAPAFDSQGHSSGVILQQRMQQTLLPWLYLFASILARDEVELGLLEDVLKGNESSLALRMYADHCDDQGDHRRADRIRHAADLAVGATHEGEKKEAEG